MSLPYVLLGLTRDGMSGYAIKRAFDDGWRHIWNAELSQIYTALKALEARGHVSSTPEAGARGAAKRIYRLTDAGRIALEQWLRTDPQMHDARHPFLVQLCLLGDLASLPQTLQYFRALESLSVARLNSLEHIEAHWRQAEPAYPDFPSAVDFHAQLALEFGLANARATLECCRRCLARVEARMETP